MMNVVIRTLLFCTLATTPLLLPAAEGGEQQPTQIPPRLLREVLADQKQLTSAAAEMIFSLNGEERAKLVELCRTDPEAAKTAILDRLGREKLRKMQLAETIRETARLFRQEKDETRKAELRTKLREQLAEQYNRTSQEIGNRLRLQEQRLAEVRQAYQKRVENADSAIDAQLERMTRPRQPKQPGKNRKK